MNAPHPPPAGWYPDPSGRAPFRYWDGQQWTEHTNQGTAPAPSVAQQAPAAPGAPAAGHDYLGTPAAFGAVGGQVAAPDSVRRGRRPTHGADLCRGPQEVRGLRHRRRGGRAVPVVSFLPWVSTEVSGFRREHRRTSDAGRFGERLERRSAWLDSWLGGQPPERAGPEDRWRHRHDHPAPAGPDRRRRRSRHADGEAGDLRQRRSSWVLPHCWPC